MKNTFQRETAVLIFANSAIEDARLKNTMANPDLFQALTKRTLQIVSASGLPYFHFTEKEQQGTSFGERFSNAIQTVYGKGYKNIITIGNDSPQLKTAHILEAEQQLQLGKTVLGPTLDGGFYLMGLHHSNFDPNLFRELPWQRFGLFNKISKLIASYDSHLFRLPVMQDLDNREDVKVLLNFSKTLPLSLLLIARAMFKKYVSIASNSITFFRVYAFTILYNKGSPFQLFQS
ncbi:MAG: DUF2064 domain-containing protein [Bacteroidota bacterium]